MNEFLPRVDILLATFNGQRYLSEQLDSLLAQDYPNFRIIVSDDGSSDSTRSLLKTYLESYPETIILIDNPAKGRGAAANFEFLLQWSLDQKWASWFCFSDQDDIWESFKISTLIKVVSEEKLTDNAFPVVIHSDLTVISSRCELLSQSFVSYERMDMSNQTGIGLLSANVVTGCAAMFNRSLIEIALPFPPEAVMHDWWCALFSSVGRRVFVPLSLVKYRQHESNHIGARSRSLSSAAKRALLEPAQLYQRIASLGVRTLQQSKAFRDRLSLHGIDPAFVNDYLSFRELRLLYRLKRYRKYYPFRTMDALVRCLLWRG